MRVESCEQSKEWFTPATAFATHETTLVEKSIFKTTTYAQGEGDIGAGACITKGGGDADGKDCRIVSLRGAGGIVIHQTNGGAAEIGWGLLKGGEVMLDGGGGREDCGEGGD